MPLADDITVYPGHGQGSACGKMMSSETTDTLGNQKKTNYALRPDMTRAEFIEELLNGLTPPPGYFPQNVMLNIQGYNEFDKVLDQGMTALTPVEFDMLKNEADVIVIDTRAPQEFAKGFVPGSWNIGSTGDLAPWAGALVRDVRQKIVFVADEGKEEEVITRLARVGFDNVLGFLKGGIEAWKKAELPVDSIKSISPAEVLSQLETNPDAVVLDVRRASEYNSEHVKGAENAPLDYILDNIAQIDPDKTYFVHCKSGYRSMVFTSILKSKGYDHLIDVKGGFNEIQKTEGFEMTEYVCPSTLL